MSKHEWCFPNAQGSSLQIGKKEDQGSREQWGQKRCSRGAGRKSGYKLTRCLKCQMLAFEYEVWLHTYLCFESCELCDDSFCKCRYMDFNKDSSSGKTVMEDMFGYVKFMTITVVKDTLKKENEREREECWNMARMLRPVTLLQVELVFEAGKSGDLYQSPLFRRYFVLWLKKQ